LRREKMEKQYFFPSLLSYFYKVNPKNKKTRGILDE